MGTLSGLFQRPVFAVSAVSLAAVYAELNQRLWPAKSTPDSCFPEPPVCSASKLASELSSPLMSNISVPRFANYSLVARLRVPVPNFKYAMTNISQSSGLTNLCSVAPSPFLLNAYQSAELAKASKPFSYVASNYTGSSSEVVYRWHLPDPNTIDRSDCSSAKSRTVVVLLGWLGAKQKHLKKYADWYTSKGFHVITFTFPMAEVLSYKVGGKAEQHVELLTNHLSDWLEEEYDKNLVFHTFSNTGWLTYGAILENFQKQDITLMGRIKGCIVDSAPVAAPDPQVWASGFSAAFLKKQSVATKGYLTEYESDGSRPVMVLKPSLTESALLTVLEKFFEVVLNLPTVNRRLTNVLGQLTSGQPSCPQLYIYSTADKVIPADSVESFIEAQQKSGREVRSCNFISSPHVDHFRHDPHKYTSQVSQFLEDCVLTCCKST